jgi:hypothetical protein
MTDVRAALKSAVIWAKNVSGRVGLTPIRRLSQAPIFDVFAVTAAEPLVNGIFRWGL